MSGSTSRRVAEGPVPGGIDPGTVCNVMQVKYIMICEFTIHLDYESRCTEWSKGSQ